MLPDREQINAQVQQLAEEARDNLPPQQPEADAFVPTHNPGVIAPIHMGRDHEVIPAKYVLHFSVTLCTNCGCESKESTFYALSYLRSRVTGARVRHLVRCDRPMFNLPVERIPTGHHKTPFCAECETISLDHLPPPPMASNVSELPEPKTKGARAKPASETKEPTKATLNDLI